ncbi:UNVERIFIED_CONTAM: hypothetical protein RMT77_003584 [Armadillidium vulgare]
MITKLQILCIWIVLLSLISVQCGAVVNSSIHYEPTWKSLDSRPLPEWYDDAKIGVFIVWGLYSVPSFGSEWFWKFLNDKSKSYIEFMKKNYDPNFTYQDFGPMFTAEFYKPEEWADIFNASGAQYVVLTSKHHDGYTLWPSKYSWNWNSMDLGPGRDLVGDLAVSVRGKYPHIHFGLYHSLYEWFNPIYTEDKTNDFTTDYFVKTKIIPELIELVKLYKPELIWSDGDWDGNYTYWKSTEFLAWLFNDSPVKDSVVVNDRWGKGTRCLHGSFYTCRDRYNPGTVQPFKWENCMTLDRSSWGYRREAKLDDYLTIQELLKIMAETVSCGGNLLVNVGPTHDGRIPPIMEERLRQMGSWLQINGEAIYGSRPWHYQNDTYTPQVWFTKNRHSKTTVYAIILKWPQNGSLILGAVSPTKNSKIHMLGYSETLLFKKVSKGVEILFPYLNDVAGEWVWVLKMQKVLPA